jgi:hypothetical protein
MEGAAPIHLNFNERRVLGALVEKSYATPDLYPLTINALVTACNQKSCRQPVTQLGEDDILDALDGLRRHGLASVVETAGGRTSRFRHRLREALEVSGPEAAVIAELILRGPQTDGELRQNASRMVKIETLDGLHEVVEALRRRAVPLVVKLGPEERRRGVRYAHALCPPAELEALKAKEAVSGADAGERSSAAPRGASPAEQALPLRAGDTGDSAGDSAGDWRDEIEALRAELTRLREEQSDLSARVSRIELSMGS